MCLGFKKTIVTQSTNDNLYYHNDENKNQDKGLVQ